MKIKGIDVSQWQGNIDWSKVKSSGIEFAILREGYRKTVDNKFRQQILAERERGKNGRRSDTWSISLHLYRWCHNCPKCEVHSG